MATHEHSDGEITLKTVIDHMQAGFVSVRGQINTLEERVNTGFAQLRNDIADLRGFQRWIESHDLQVRVSKLEDKVFLGIDP